MVAIYTRSMVLTVIVVSVMSVVMPGVTLAWLLFDFFRNADPPAWWDYAILGIIGLYLVWHLAEMTGIAASEIRRVRKLRKK